MSTLRFKVGEAVRVIRGECPEIHGQIFHVTDARPFTLKYVLQGAERDYVIENAIGAYCAYDHELAPYPDPSEFDRDTEMWEDFKRLTGYQTPREVTCE